jgi:hypothetical protein
MRLDRIYARLLLERPERACSYTRDGRVEIGKDVASSPR